MPGLLHGPEDSDLELIHQALESCDGVKTCAAELLGVSEKTIRRRLLDAEKTVDLEWQVRTLTERVSALSKKLNQERQRQGGSREYRKLITEAMKQPRTPPAWVSGAGRPGSPNTAVTLLSDIHFGEVVRPDQVYGLNGYNTEVAAWRMKRFFEGGPRIVKEIFSDTMPIEGFVQGWLGDMLSGSIHEELVSTNERPPLELLLEIADLLVAGVRMHRAQLPDMPLHIVCVPGNHSRLSRKPPAKNHNEDNLDWLLFHMVERSLRDDPKVTFQIERAMDTTVEILGWRFRVTHGHQARGGAGVLGPLAPLLRMDMKKRRLLMQTGESYDYLISGHFHSFVPNLHGVIVNGSLVGYDEYAASNNFPYQPPQQGFFLVHPTRGVTYSTPVFVAADGEQELWPDGS